MIAIDWRIAADVRSWLPVLVLCAIASAKADEPTQGATPGGVDDFGAVIESSKAAVVVITAADRKGGSGGLGSGFIIDPSGVIVTNLHVIERGRAFRVQLPDNRFVLPTKVLAYSRAEDLAVVQVDERDLPFLPLGDSDNVKSGQSVACIGHPLGLRMSVARGVIGGLREFDGRSLLQVAMPIEVGNSGGPLINPAGEVLGVVTIKSAASLGFAVPSNEVKRLLANPHPIPIARWQTIGALNAKRWRPLMGGQWSQRAGKVISSGQGSGFGGRTLCLLEEPPPDGHFSVAVEVKLSNESGAAGLIFHSDGGDRHYGFYPTGGALRLARFEGPSAFNWTILQTVDSDQYRLGDWNEVRVSVDGPRLRCFVNDELVIDLQDEGLTAGRVGLVKFREPSAEFRRFRLGRELPTRRVDSATSDQILGLLSQLPERGEPDQTVVTELARYREQAASVLRKEVEKIEREATRLRHITDIVHHRIVEREMEALFDAAEDDVDLLQATLLLAKLDNPNLEVSAYVEQMDTMAEDLRALLAKESSDAQKLDRLMNYFFGELSFHGSRSEYYHRSNSYVNEVLDDREGLPITLSVVFMELARRAGMRVEGVGIPQHFVVRYVSEAGEGQLIDVFGGKKISRAEAEVLSDARLTEEHLQTSNRLSIVVRMLRNLTGVASREEDLYGMLRYTSLVLILQPESAEDRLMRARLRLATAQPKGAEADLRWILENAQGSAASREAAELLRRVR